VQGRSTINDREFDGLCGRRFHGPNENSVEVLRLQRRIFWT
jgi:hypothetical protein